MLKRLLKRPMFWSLLALIACAVWPLRPLDRTALFPVQFANGKYGYVNPHGRIAVAGVWDKAYSFAADGRAVVKREDKYGFIDREGKLSEPLEELRININWHAGNSLLWKDKIGRLSGSGQLVSTSDRHTPLWQFKSPKKGLRQGGKIIVDPVWDGIEPFDAADLAAVQQNGKWGYIDRAQKIVIPLEWETAEPFAKNRLARVSTSDRVSFIDQKGKVVIALELSEASNFQDNGLARIKKDGMVGFIDRTGKHVIQPSYTEASEFDHKDVVHVQLNNRHGFIDAKGASVIPLQWDNVTPFDDAPSPVRSDIEIIDQDGKTIPGLWDLLGPYYGASSPARSDIEIIDQDSKSHSTSTKVAKAVPKKDGLSRVQKNGKWGCINRRGEVVVDVEWDTLSGFNRMGLAKVSRNGKHGLINRKGEIVISPEWDDTLDFDDKGMAIAKLAKKFGFIDIAGKIVVPIEWDHLREPIDKEGYPPRVIYESMRDLSRRTTFDSRGTAIVNKNQKYGFIDRTGKIVIPLVWEDVYSFDEKEMAIVKRNGKSLLSG